MKKAINTIHVEGRIFQHDLEVKTSKKGVEYIGGKIEVAVDEEGLNVVPVRFVYTTPFWGNTTKPNNSYGVLAKIISEGKTIVTDGIEAATKVSIDGNLNLNEFVNSQDELVVAKVQDGTFISIVNALNNDEEKRHSFQADMLIQNIKHIDADEEKNIPKDFVSVNGMIFGYPEIILPMDFTVRKEDGIKYFDNLEVTASQPIFTKVWGVINSVTVKVQREEESAFGAPRVTSYDRKEKAWDITGMSSNYYELGDEKKGITGEELTAKMQAREIKLADIKKSAAERKAAAATPSAFGAAATAPAGDAPASTWKF